MNMTNRFWKVVESTLKYVVPEHIKNSINMSGFGDALVFKDLTEADIAKIEKYMRERALDEFATALSESIDKSCDALVDQNQLVEIFGEKYAECPEKFQFLPGEVKMLKVLANHVKKLVDGNGENMGLEQFSDKKKKIKNKNLLLKRIAKSHSQVDTGTKLIHRQSTKGMFKSLLVCLSLYDIDLNGWTEDLVQIDSSGSHGSVKCILCDESEEPKRVYYHTGSRSSYWVFSNFKKHMKKLHNLVAKVKSKRKNDVALDYELQTSQELKETPANDAQISSNPLQSMDTHSEEFVEIKAEQSSNEMDDSVKFLGVVANSTLAETNTDSDSWLYEQMSVQIQQMVAANLVNGESEETMEFQLKDQPPRHISVVATSPDGSCLFSALAHQLWRNPITSQTHIKKTKELRAMVVEHILNPLHYHLYEQIIIDRLNKKTAVPTNECKMFIRHGLARGKWGGLETLKAVSNEFHVNIVIINECASCNMITGSHAYNNTLVLAYRLNQASVYDHYDSVSDMDSEVIFSTAKFITNK